MFRSPSKQKTGAGNRSDSSSIERHNRNTRSNSRRSESEHTNPSVPHQSRKPTTAFNMNSNALSTTTQAPPVNSEPAQPTPPPTNQQVIARANTPSVQPQAPVNSQPVQLLQSQVSNIPSTSSNAPPQADSAPPNSQAAITELQTQFAQMQSVLAALTTSQQQMSQLLQVMAAPHSNPQVTVLPQQPTNNAHSAITTPDSHSIFRRMQLPRISKVHPEHSFGQLECYMSKNNIISDDDKFGVLQLAIEPETTAHVSTIIENPPSIDRYKTLKDAIIKLYAESQTIKMRKLLSQTKFRSTKPSLILSEMRQLHPNHGENEIFKSLFLERLPPRIRNAVTSLKLLVPSANTFSLDAIAEYADQQMDDIDNETIQAIRSHQSHEVHPVESMEAIIERVCKKFFTSERGRSRSRPRHQSNRSPSQPPQTKPITSQSTPVESGPRPCYFHVKYGNDRHENFKCYPGCKFHQEWLAIQAQKN